MKREAGNDFDPVRLQIISFTLVRVNVDSIQNRCHECGMPTTSGDEWERAK